MTLIIILCILHPSHDQNCFIECNELTLLLRGRHTRCLISVLHAYDIEKSRLGILV